MKKLENLPQKQKDTYRAQMDKTDKEDKSGQVKAILTDAKAEDAQFATETVKSKAASK
ncbi:hypothetical protein [Staphylococcus simulans]